ncbi:MAG: bifunctional class I SAM-dependent methyltransferase/glycosyltransferase family 2 protein [Opitutus sp.]
MSLPSKLTCERLDALRDYFDHAPVDHNKAGRDYRSLLAHHYRHLISSDASVLEIGCGSGELLAQLQVKRKVGVDVSPRQIDAARIRVPEGEFFVQAGELLELTGTFDYIILSDTLNLAADAQQLLERLHGFSHADTRLLVNFYSSLWRPLLSLAQAVGLKAPQPETSWLSTSDVRNLLSLSDWSPIVFRPQLLIPIRMFGFERLVNRWLAPFLGWFCLTIFCTAHSKRSKQVRPATVSIVIPARNEAGNIADAVRRIPPMGASVELIFVEGHSSDETWSEILRVAESNPAMDIKVYQQSGVGKGDAVRLGFAKSSGDILMILDADLTMPPEELPKFYDVIVHHRAEFANGCRLVYPMGGAAMPFLNLCANKGFALLFTWILGQPIKDTLCGTKVLRRAHYLRIAANRGYFGDFDPFGDFDLLFGAAKLNMKIADVPIRYRDRTYGSTNIQRWRHGLLLWRMVAFAARKLKFI